jgi:hypothetical protein
MSKQIQLSQGKYAIVDDEDYECFIRFKWLYTKRGYASAGFNLMHRVVIGALDGEIVDHIDGDKLNNQKSNLRVCTLAENQWNTSVRIKNKSGFKGIYAHQGKWAARIRCNGGRFYLGVFSCPIEAAKAYNSAAIQYHGEFANLNEIPAQ